MLLRLQAPDGSLLDSSLKILKLHDGSLQSATYGQIKARIRRYAGPDDDALRLTSKARVEHWARRLGERMELAFDRFDEYLEYSNSIDPGTTWSIEWKFQRVLWHSELKKEEQDRLFMSTEIDGDSTKYVLLRAKIIKLNDQIFKLDVLRLGDGKNKRLGVHRTYVVDNPAEDVAGTEITLDDIDDVHDNMTSFVVAPGVQFTLDNILQQVPEYVATQLGLNTSDRNFTSTENCEVFWVHEGDTGFGEESGDEMIGVTSDDECDSCCSGSDSSGAYEAYYVDEGSSSDSSSGSDSSGFDTEDEDLQREDNKAREVFIATRAKQAKDTGQPLLPDELQGEMEDFMEVYYVQKGKGNGRSPTSKKPWKHLKKRDGRDGHKHRKDHRGRRDGRKDHRRKDSRGRGRDGRKGSGRGRRTSRPGHRSDSRKPHGHSKPRRDPTKPRKGPQSSHSRTRGYDANKAGRDLRPKTVPVNFKNKHKVCPMCNNKNAAGRPVVGHLPGDPICPKVQSGEQPKHPRYAKVEKQFAKTPNHQKRTTFKKKDLERETTTNRLVSIWLRPLETSPFRMEQQQYLEQPLALQISLMHS